MYADGLTKLSTMLGGTGRVDLLEHIMLEGTVRISYCDVSGRREKSAAYREAHSKPDMHELVPPLPKSLNSYGWDRGEQM